MNYFSRFNKKSQICRDSYDLQVYYVQKRDEICKNGEVLTSNAFSFKQNALEHSELNTSEDSIVADILSTDFVLKYHADLLKTSKFKVSFKTCDNLVLSCGDFVKIQKDPREKFANLNEPIFAHIVGIYEFEMDVKFLVQIYLKPSDIVGHIHKYIHNELFQSDLYELVDLKQIMPSEKYFVLSIRDYTTHMIEHVDESKKIVDLKEEHVYVCESMYSTKDKLFRKIRKWLLIQPMEDGQLNATFSKLTSNFVNQQLQNSNLRLKLRPINLQLPERVFLNLNELNDIKNKINVYIQKYLSMNKIDNLSSMDIINENARENILLTQSQQAAVQENEHFVYYEQVFYFNNCFKLGDYVYMNSDFQENETGLIIMRIDKLWKSNLDKNEEMFYIKGPRFLRPIDITHEPIRLFYKNEVFKENNKEITKNLRQFHGMCMVLSWKRYITCRPTQINDCDVYVCDSKYDSELKTLKKFTKGLKKFELSHKSNEEEYFFFKRELQYYKNLSPLLIDDNYEMNLNLNLNQEQAYMDDYSMLSSDHNIHESINHSNIMSPSKSHKTKITTFDDTDTKPKKKKRVKRSKKCGYNIFSREFRQKLRDENSPLTFIEMSREVGNHWRLLTDAERQHYEERAVEESAKEAAKEAAREAALAAAMAAASERQKIEANTKQQQQQQFHVGNNGTQMSQLFSSPAVTKQNPTYVQQSHQQHLQQHYSIINVTPSNAVQMNLNYGPSHNQHQTGFILKPSEHGSSIGHMQLNDYHNNQQQHQHHLQKQPMFVNPPQKTTHRALHTDAYLRYIENLKKSQDSHYQKPISSNWQSLLDIRPSSIKDSEATVPIPTNWIENISASNVHKHLMSLRYYLLNDAINIDKYNENDECYTYICDLDETHESNSVDEAMVIQD